MNNQIQSEYFWEDTLPEFLNASNEDEIITNIFINHILPQIEQKETKKLKWLEVGCGNFCKTYNFYKHISNSKKVYKTQLQVVEPSHIWIEKINQNYSKLFKKNDDLYLNKLKLEDYVKYNHYNFDFISIIQVLYEKEVTSAFLKMLDTIVQNKNRSTIFISLESENSDFAIIRKKLSKLGLSIPKSQSNILDFEIKKRNLNYSIINTVGKICQINYKELHKKEDFWLFPFLLGISKKQFNLWEKHKRDYVIEIVTHHITSLRKRVLSIEDRALIISI